jgi:hypothetical protein
MASRQLNPPTQNTHTLNSLVGPIKMHVDILCIHYWHYLHFLPNLSDAVQ